MDLLATILEVLTQLTSLAELLEIILGILRGLGLGV
jgi:hypothetical protein